MPRLYADLALREAKIATLDTPNRFVGALAARDGRIVAVGADAELDGLIGPDATVVRRSATSASSARTSAWSSAIAPR